MSPVPFFQQVQQVGLLCAVDSLPDRVGSPLGEAALCDLAMEEMKSLIGNGGPPVVVLALNDERIADPDTLVILLHVTLRGSSSGRLLALSAGLHRTTRPEMGSPPFFVAPPQAVITSGSTVPPEEMRDALRQLLDGVARAIRTNR